MTTNANSLYDAPTREIYLLENVPIHGRKTELRQLLKLLNLAKTGQPKAALITGDAGIGKSALMDVFVNLVKEGVYCRILDLGKMTHPTPEAVYVSIVDKLRAEANSILDEALVAVNEITRELDLHWERQDLVRAIALVKLQESIGGKDAVSQEQLVKAIRSQVPAVKKLKFSVNESIEKLVDLIVNPWVMVATSILTPMSPPLQEAIRLADRLKAELGLDGTTPQDAHHATPQHGSPQQTSPKDPASRAAGAGLSSTGSASNNPSGVGTASTSGHAQAHSYTSPQTHAPEGPHEIPAHGHAPSEQASSGTSTASEGPNPATASSHHDAASENASAGSAASAHYTNHAVRQNLSQPAVSDASASATPTARDPLPEVGIDFFDDGIVSAPRPARKTSSEPDSHRPTGESARPIGDMEFLTPSVIPSVVDPLYSQPSAPMASTEVLGPMPPGSMSLGSMHTGRVDASAKPIKDPLIRHLMAIFNFINSAINNIDSGLLIVVDEWDRILHTPGQPALKEFFTELLYQVTEQKNYHFMIVMTARTEGESYTLGGAIYNHFRTKLLLEALNEATARKLTRSVLKGMSVELDEAVHRRLFALSKGNPYWHLKTVHYMRERVESNNLKFVDASFFDRLGIDSVEDLLELSFTRLKLTFLNDEDSLYKVIASLIKQFDEGAFSANQAIREISTSQGFTDGYVFEVLRALFRHNFIRQIEYTAESPGDRQAEAPSQPAGGGSARRMLEDRSRKDPHYTIESRFVLKFLQEKTGTIETDISTDEKLMYLKKIIPLSVKSGDLDREKTMEVLALSDAMGNPDIVTFLEDIFIEYMQDEKPVVRVTSLNNLALLDSARAREALFKAMRDEDSMVREYAARNLAQISQKNTDPTLANRIVDILIECIDDESEAVRAQIYGTISKYRWHRDLTNVFIKGMSDVCESVRLTSIKNLAEMETDSPYAFTCLLDAMADKVHEIRRYACIGLQKYPTSEAIDAIVRILQKDADSSIRALAADSLSRMEDPKAFQALVNALRREKAEDVKLAVVRALGKRRGWQTEAILLESLASADTENMPVFVWAGIRSLGQVGGTERSLGLLAEIKARVGNPIILSAIETAHRKIRERINELQQMERQLGEATPLTVAVPSEYDEEVVLPEEEVLEEEGLLEEDGLPLTEAKTGPTSEPSNGGPSDASERSADHPPPLVEARASRFPDLPFSRN